MMVRPKRQRSMVSWYLNIHRYYPGEGCTEFLYNDKEIVKTSKIK